MEESLMKTVRKPASKKKYGGLSKEAREKLEKEILGHISVTYQVAGSCSIGKPVSK